MVQILLKGVCSDAGFSHSTKLDDTKNIENPANDNHCTNDNDHFSYIDLRVVIECILLDVFTQTHGVIR